jgi:LAS superfamily LD-carboxypeptidase LdcB
MDNCVYSTDTITPLEDYSGNDVTKDCAAQEDLTRRFKGHLVNLSDDDVVDAALFPENIDAQSAAQTGSSSGDAVSLSGDLIKGTPIDPVDTDELSCPVSPTITDAGIDSEAYNQGSQFSIRLCSVHNVRLNAIAAKQFDDLFTEAATAGFTIKGTGGFRTMAGQREGYNSAPDTFARPGYSNHQYGTAADISCQGGGADYTAGTGRGRDSFLAGVGQYPCLKWIAQNSPKFGLLIQCMAEGSDGRAIRAGSGGCEWWHLSPTGG